MDTVRIEFAIIPPSQRVCYCEVAKSKATRLCKSAHGKTSFGQHPLCTHELVGHVGTTVQQYSSDTAVDPRFLPLWRIKGENRVNYSIP